MILTAGYILWTIQRVYLGPEYKGPHGDHLHADDAARAGDRRAAVGAWRSVFGVYPQAVFNYMTPSVDQTVDDLADWTEDVRSRADRAPKPRRDERRSESLPATAQPSTPDIAPNRPLQRLANASP